SLSAAAINHATRVAQNNIFLARTERLKNPRARNRGGAGAVEHDTAVGDFTFGDKARVDQCRSGNNRGAMLVVMEYRDLHFLFQTLFDHKALGRGHVLEIY